MHVKSIIEQNPANIGKFDMVSNPEFLREGVAIKDFMYPDRIVIGSPSDKAIGIMKELYQPLTDDGAALLATNLPSSEMIKYASNAMLAIKISFINEMSQFADVVGADIQAVSRGMGLDKRINPFFLQPGPGFGGSCFPKDSNALVYMGKQHGLGLKSVSASLEVNEDQRQKVIAKLDALVPDLKGKTVAMLGLAFKANTDDIRVAPSLDIIEHILEKGGTVKAYDPAAMENTKRMFPTLSYMANAYDAVAGADVVLIMTEWDEFKNLDIKKMAELVAHKVIVDARNLYDPIELKKLGFACDNMGRSYLCK
jgi:UDPglucose 6-dehydrogenase